MATMPNSNADRELVEVFATQEETEAMVIESLLDSADIEYVVGGEAAQGVMPGVGGISLRVSPEYADEARKLIEEYRNKPVDDVVVEDDSTDA